MKHTVTVLIAGILLTHNGLAADTVRVMTYNVLKFSADNVDGRIPNFRTILDSVRPDILICQEVSDASMGPLFVADVFTWSPFAATPFIDGPDTDCQLFYDQNQFDFLSQRRISTELRDIAEFTLVTRPTNALPPDTVVFYGCHLKASEGSPNEQQRSREVTAMMSDVTSHNFAFIVGDMNIYTPLEPAYQAITDPLAPRPFIDPLGADWERNSTAHARFYTQCSRATFVSSCGGGVNGGLDDRFDFIFISAPLAPRLVADTYTHVGNDGVPRLNASINDPPNTHVSQQMADALLCASDHLPVFVDVILGDVKADVLENGVLLPELQFTESGVVITHCIIGQPISITDLNGRLVLRVTATADVMQITTSHLPHGLYIVTHSTLSSRLSI